MQIPFDTPARKWLIAAITVLLAAAYVGLAGTLFLAAWFGERAELTSLQRAVRFDPANANYRNHLGRYYELVARDPAAAIGPYTEAIRLNPHSARFWFDLASAYQVRGDVANQTAALEHAIEADPTTPDVAWEAANLGLAPGRKPLRARFISAFFLESGNQWKFQSRYPERRLRLAASETEERRTHAGSQRLSRRTAVPADRLRWTQS